MVTDRLLGMPRCWNGKTILASLVNCACGYPQIVTKPDYLKPPPDEVTALRNIMVTQMCEHIDKVTKSVWNDICNKPRYESVDGKVTVEYIVDVTRTDRRGRYLKRPV